MLLLCEIMRALVVGASGSNQESTEHEGQTLARSIKTHYNDRNHSHSFHPYEIETGK